MRILYIHDSNKPLLEASNDYCNMFDDSESDLNSFLLKGYLSPFKISLKKYLFKRK